MLALGIVLGLPVRAAADGPTTFSNATSIAIPATNGAGVRPASPYPSTIAVSGMDGAVTKVRVSFNQLTHGGLGDIDAMVVAPDGTSNLVLLSDVGNPDQLVTITDQTLTFDDAAGSVVPAQLTVTSGTYRPTNTNAGGAADSFPAPAPTPSSQTTLAGAFTGLSSANGTWSLYVVDDVLDETGTMAGGWSIEITTEVSAVSTTTTVTSSDATSTTGQQVIFTATVRADGAPVPAGGTVQFADGSVNLGSPVPVSASGIVTYPTEALAEGTHQIRATYSGITGYLTSNGQVTQRVDNATVVTDTTYCNTGAITGPGSACCDAVPVEHLRLWAARPGHQGHGALRRA